ncbi:MAG: RNA polymerase sigma factor [Clostridia bacterium]|nr:RNA polymerase sigma factor [Clostridia bacterium]
MFIFQTFLWVDALQEEPFKVDAAKAFKTYSGTVYRLAFVRTGNTADADDILSDVFVRLIKNISKIKSEVHLRSWLIRATVNQSKTYYKKSKRIEKVRLADIDGAVQQNSEENLVLPAVMELPYHQKTVIYMHYFEGYSVEEIAGICGIAKGTVKSRLARARKTLKTTLEGVIMDV